MALFGASFSIREIQRTGREMDIHLSGQVFQDSGRVDGGGGSDTSMAGCAVLQVSVDTSNGELFDDDTENLVGGKIDAFVISAGSSLFTCRPARAERETAFAFAFPESFPAFPPAFVENKQTITIFDGGRG
jgi:hypothetical protein